MPPATPPHLDEKTSASPGVSPGVVEDDEILLRELFNPQHVENGKVLTRAISLTELRTDGFSVHRKRYTDANRVRAAQQERLAKPRSGTAWTDEGIAEIETLKVRQFKVDEERAFVVIDTAEETNPAHASIYAAMPGVGKAHARELRNLLLPLLQTRRSVSAIFSGQ